MVGGLFLWTEMAIKELLTIDELSKALKTPVATLYSLLSQRRIKEGAYKIGKKWRFDFDKVLMNFQQGKVR